jgi:signal transduction histidine kinase
VQHEFAAGGWSRVRALLRSQAGAAGGRLLAVDNGGRVVAASDDELESAEVKTANGGDGTLMVLTRTEGVVARLELKGAPSVIVRSAGGGEVGRVFVLPAGSAAPARLPGPIVPAWVVSIAVTALVALLVTFALSGRILHPVSALTDAARRMREGDLGVRVRPDGNDEIARLGRAFNEMAERLAQTERVKQQMVSDVAHELRSPVTNLRCGLESIQDGLTAPDAARIDALHSETLLLQRLIGDLQDLALADSAACRFGSSRSTSRPSPGARLARGPVCASICASTAMPRTCGPTPDGSSRCCATC